MSSPIPRQTPTRSDHGQDRRADDDAEEQGRGDRPLRGAPTPRHDRVQGRRGVPDPDDARERGRDASGQGRARHRLRRPVGRSGGRSQRLPGRRLRQDRRRRPHPGRVPAADRDDAVRRDGLPRGAAGVLPAGRGDRGPARRRRAHAVLPQPPSRVRPARGHLDPGHHPRRSAHHAARDRRPLGAARRQGPGPDPAEVRRSGRPGPPQGLPDRGAAADRVRGPAVRRLRRLHAGLHRCRAVRRGRRGQPRLDRDHRPGDRLRRPVPADRAGRPVRPRPLRLPADLSRQPRGPRVRRSSSD